MKSTIKLFTLALVALFAVSCNNNDEYDMLNSLWRNVTQNEARIDDLEKWCSQANTNITSLQTIVNVIENNDVVTSVTPIMENGVEIGYTITFADHDPITIYHGKDGKDGANGADGANGQDGASPIVGVAKDTDGVYYWTLNGEWLLDADGNKLRVSGQDGAAGADGRDGQKGQDGADGQDGVTPQLKIEADYWWISYDNGNTWTQLGKAKGDKGDTGATGADGQDGDSMFQSVTQDAANVYFTLADGTVITIAKGGGGADDGGYIFTITYMPNGGEGDVVVDTAYYANAYTLRNTALFSKSGFYIAMWNTKPDGTGVDFSGARELISISRNITFYAKWVQEGVPYGVDLGLSVKWANWNVGANKIEEYGDYFAWGETETKSSYSSGNYSYSATPDVLPLDRDAAAVNWGGTWRMPTLVEYNELKNNCTWIGTRNYNGTGIYGVLVKSNINGNIIFFPVTGYYSGTSILDRGFSAHYYCHYWSSSIYSSDNDYGVHMTFDSSNEAGNVGLSQLKRNFGCPIRPVCE